MAGHVYREFESGDILSTKVHSQPSIVVESGSLGWTGNTNLGTNALSLYGGTRRRSDVKSGSVETSGLEVYPVDLVDTHSIDKVIGIPGEYPATASINFVYCTKTDPPNISPTDTRWYDRHWSAINNLSDWCHYHVSPVYPKLDELPETMTVIHAPSMFYGREIVTGSVYVWSHAWDSTQVESPGGFQYEFQFEFGGQGGSGDGAVHFKDDGNGRLFQVPSGSDWKTAWMSGSASLAGYVYYEHGLIVFTNPSATWHQEFISASYNTQSLDSPNMHVQFSGSTIIQSMVFMCRMGVSEVNASNQKSFQISDTRGNMYSRLPDPRTYITAVGLYNEDRQLVAVAKIAQPIRKREQDSIDIRLRMDL